MTAPPATVTEDLVAVYRELEAMHAWRGWHWWPDPDPFEVVVGAILVQNTSWTNVERALANLRPAGALDPAAMAALSDADLEELVRPSGQYRQKAKKLRAFLATTEAYGGLAPLLALDAELLRDACLSTWGIGPETADCIVSYAGRHPAFVVDAYTIRLFSRLGLGPVETASYDAWQRYFLDALAVAPVTISSPGSNDGSQFANSGSQDPGTPVGDSTSPSPPLGLSCPPAEDSSLLPPPSSLDSALRDFYCRYHALIVLHCKHTCLKRTPRCGECALAPRCPAAVR